MKFCNISMGWKWFGLVLLIGFCAAGCGSRQAGAKNEKPVVTVNQLQLTERDLQEELKGRRVAPATANGKEPEWLNQLIDRELLVQEAQRLGLDREQDFMRTIEHFWKQALIKQLINRKGREINADLHIYEPQIEAYYKKMAQEKGGTIESLSVLRKEIARTLQEEAADKAMEDWLADLRTQAHISIDRETLAKLEKA